MCRIARSKFKALKGLFAAATDLLKRQYLGYCRQSTNNADIIENVHGHRMGKRWVVIRFYDNQEV
jgi:hypothetical protein